MNSRLNKIVLDRNLLKACQIGFLPNSSVLFAHLYLESRIQLAQDNRYMWALVRLDIAKAYNSAEPSVLVRRLVTCEVPSYALRWIEKFLTGRELFWSDGRLLSRKYRQTRRVPQGVVLSPLLFNILMSSILTMPNVHTFVYVEDIAFSASSTLVESSYVLLQWLFKHFGLAAV